MIGELTLSLVIILAAITLPPFIAKITRVPVIVNPTQKFIKYI